MEPKLDLLLIAPGNFKKEVYQELSADYSAIETPFWAALTAGFIRNKGFNVKILDANAENLTTEETAQKILWSSPKLVGIIDYGQQASAGTHLMTVIGSLCREIKKISNLPIVLIGLHSSALPKRTLKEEETDYVAQGEGFYTLLGLLQNKPLPKIPGLWYYHKGEIKNNLPAPLIQNLDEELPDVAWDLLPMDKYKAHNWHCLHNLNSRMSYASISTSLGCPFNCDFCCINAPFGKPSYRTWSPEWTLKQIDILVKNYNIKNLKFIDELFILKPEHFLAIAQGLAERNYNLNIWVYARIDTIKEEHLDLMKKAGINWFGIGIESGDDEVRKAVSKGAFEEQAIKQIIRKIRNHGIHIVANFMFGLPEDTLETMQKTLDLSLELNCEWGNFFCTVPYPGSKLYQEALENNIQLPEQWQDYSQHGYGFLPLTTKTLTPAQVLKFRDDAFQTYFTNQKYLDMIEKTFNKEAREHLEEMTKIKLKRKILGD